MIQGPNRATHRQDGTTVLHIKSLGRNYEVRLDTADYPKVRKFRWYLSHAGGGRKLYVLRTARRKRIYLHNVIAGRSVDHKDFNGLDNRRSNLRPATTAQQFAHRPKARTYRGVPTSSIYRGVTWLKKKHCWSAHIQFKGRGHRLGYFKVEDDAAKAYDAAAIKLHGEFAILNFPEGAKS